MHEEESLLGAIRGARNLRTHHHLLQWLQRDVGRLMPHDVLIAAWGDFPGGRLCLDVVSSLPGMRTTLVCCAALTPLLIDLFDCWHRAACVPVATDIGGSTRAIASSNADVEAIGRMRSAVVHGVKDERAGLDCLYAALDHETTARPCSVEAMGLLLPYIDAAFRKVSLLPMQQHGRACSPTAAGMEDGGKDAGSRGDIDALLSGREQEIMRWVCVGKTNPEIGRILNISPLTVRNHLQRIFRKLDVLNRAQAVFELEQRWAPSGAKAGGL